MNIRLMASSLGLTLTIGGIFLCRREEKKFLSIYITLVFQIFDSHKATIASKLSMHPCLLHAVWKALTGHIVFSLLDAILSLRAASRALIGIYDITSRITNGTANQGLVTNWFDHLCFPKRSFPKDPAIACFMVLELSLQFTLGCLTLRKTMHLEGVWSLKAAHSRRTNYPFKYHRTMVAVASYLGCHAIVGMHRLGDPSASKPSDEIVFSTFDSTWDSRTNIGPRETSLAAPVN
ncbi:hypothetical protein L218DRAFT_948341 [Marasmius fiardii PR-910]|nr:hypothetical protein L218DRAFT_948341 [Marasmius fiardii PR-910]